MDSTTAPGAPQLNNTPSNYAMAWHGLPAYAARLIRHANGVFPVIATHPVVPIAGMDELLPGRIRWIDDRYAGGWAGLKLAVPRLYFQPSWNTPAFNQLGAEVLRAGGRVIVMFDNPWKGSLRQLLAAIRFRTQWRNRFSGAWVCGQLGHRLARIWGFKEEQIFHGMYGSDPRVFSSARRPNLATRPKRFIFVGRLIDEKGILELLQAWKIFTPKYPEWELHIYGSGPREKEVKAVTCNVVYQEFQQPEAIAAAMQNAQFLVLPSYDEHWGLVVCEAAQAGCGLLLSANVGSAPDLIGKQNGRIFPAQNAQALRESLIWATQRTAADLQQIEQESVALGGQFTPSRWADAFEMISRRF